MHIYESRLANASKQVFLGTLPPVLVLHLNRVRYDAATGSITKVEKSIRLAPELEIPLGTISPGFFLAAAEAKNACDSVISDIMVPTAQRLSEPPHYKLHGVLYHHGESAGSGHYSVDVLYLNGAGDTGEVWLRIDDETVNSVGHEDVFGERAGDERCTYLLFYCRTPSTGAL